MPTLEDYTKLLPAEVQQTALSGSPVPHPTTSPAEQQLLPETNTQGEGYRLNRAASAVRGLLPTSGLEAAAGIPRGPQLPAPAQGGEVEAAPTPEGEPNGPSIPVLSGLMNIVGGGLDFLGKASLAPSYLGRYKDPTTGILYRESSQADNIARLSDIAPQLAGIDIGGLPDRLKGMLSFWNDYGISPVDQMGQVFSL